MKEERLQIKDNLTIIVPGLDKSFREKLPFVGDKITQSKAKILWQDAYEKAIEKAYQFGFTTLDQDPQTESRREVTKAFFINAQTHRNFDITWVIGNDDQLRWTNLIINSSDNFGASMHYDYKIPDPNHNNGNYAMSAYGYYLPTMAAAGLLDEFIKSDPSYHRALDAKQTARENLRFFPNRTLGLAKEFNTPRTLLQIYPVKISGISPYTGKKLL